MLLLLTIDVLGCDLDCSYVNFDNYKFALPLDVLTRVFTYYSCIYRSYDV